jgi:hypothetical protein
LPPRTRNNSFSHGEVDPVVLEPPVSTNPALNRPVLPAEDVQTIRRLSGRVNVLPVIAKADTLTNERLAAVKTAIRRDLAEAGIGFGIFDDPASHAAYADITARTPTSANGAYTNGYSNNGHHHADATPPESPAQPAYLRLPYALISPDMYSHSDGVPRQPLSRQELILQYTPAAIDSARFKLVRGKYVRQYRWGSLDVLDPSHSDFLPLRAAILHHMEVSTAPLAVITPHTPPLRRLGTYLRLDY